MMLEPPDSLAASYRLVALIDKDMVMAPSEWSDESSWRIIKHGMKSIKLHRFKHVEIHLLL